MSSYADWKPVPKQSLGIVRRAASRLKSQGVVVILAVAMAGFALSSFMSPIAAILCLVAITLLGAAFLPGDYTRHSLILQELTQKFQGKHYYAVNVTIYKDEKRIGQDQGVVTFEYGMLLYQGLQTDFALGRGDVFLPEGSEKMDQRFGDPTKGMAWGFKLADDPSIRIRFQSLSIKGSEYISGPLAQWLNSDEVAGWRRKLPPNVPLPKRG